MDSWLLQIQDRDDILGRGERISKRAGVHGSSSPRGTGEMHSLGQSSCKKRRRPRAQQASQMLGGLRAHLNPVLMRQHTQDRELFQQGPLRGTMFARVDQPIHVHEVGMGLPPSIPHIMRGSAIFMSTSTAATRNTVRTPATAPGDGRRSWETGDHVQYAPDRLLINTPGAVHDIYSHQAPVKKFRN
ncbi:uncharacterized protein BO80DRAFT_444663 [Aspergillus ibericus CBS 121593]|uniref:Uncharacterized protein n=1 Tax=Aspergillus ibericus CBS 121593 TaxID=1448316 RepID=A0A395H089_9EURO|nr:hypothetical protein BO80DRAFT_444663 [Aspergillus ibericus CBS 121593]RAL01216.1 hypothetical protein BO80DRAFT_444663 [Aspergillus ibericus CBS 121593]